MFKVGDLVRFNHEKANGPDRRIVSVSPDGMIELEDMAGYFAPHLFTAANDTVRCPER